MFDSITEKEIQQWTLQFQDYAPMACQVPCSLYSILLENNLIEDPFYALNEEEVRDLCEFPCEFSCEFHVDEKSKFMELVFGGLDTICDIYLNGRKLDSVKNMHRSFTYSVEDRVKVGTNTIRLVFSPPIEYFRYMDNRYHVYTNQDTISGAANLRKAFYMSGWDWGPQLPDMGIWKPVTLRQYDIDALEDFEIRQVHKDDSVVLRFWASTKQQNKNCEMYVATSGQRVQLEGGYGEIVIDNPKLWWPNGYGEQNLYDVVVELVYNGAVIDSMKKQIGLRTLTVSTEPDKEGSEFCFVVNGVKIFAMGANHVPQDNILSRITTERTEKLIQSCVDANFNCIRVWGGAYYPEEEFYDLCDRYGLIVWQDFMIACMNMNHSKEYKQTFVQECKEQVKRLRHRASLGLLCGNNEMEYAILYWDIPKGKLVCNDYLEMYERILPDICYELAPDVFYWPSSPSCGGDFDEPGDATRGDQHFWDVWILGKPFGEYREHKFRFCSEFGFESFPSMKTIKTFAKPEDYNPFGRVVDYHQKCKFGTKAMISYISEEYLYPIDFEKLVYTSQVMQAEAIRYGVEHFRRNRGCCMGSLYWQLNDCWPAISWSSLDYFGRYKALHYAAKKFYAPVLCSLFYEEHKIVLNIANETRKEIRGVVKTRLCRNDFTILAQQEIPYCVDALSSLDIGAVSDQEVDNEYNCYFYADLYDENGNFVMRQTLLFTKAKNFGFCEPNVTADIQDSEGGVTITLIADCFAKHVEVEFAEADVVLSDNYVDITSKEPVVLTAKTSYKAEELRKQLTIQSVYDIGTV